MVTHDDGNDDGNDVDNDDDDDGDNNRDDHVDNDANDDDGRDIGNDDHVVEDNGDHNDEDRFCLCVSPTCCQRLWSAVRSKVLLTMLHCINLQAEKRRSFASARGSVGNTVVQDLGSQMPAGATN